ncbi:MAG: hypothetical protein ACI809_001332, partial [Candidatus Azotimanducaceae bacterium]
LLVWRNDYFRECAQAAILITKIELSFKRNYSMVSFKPKAFKAKVKDV